MMMGPGMGMGAPMFQPSPQMQQAPPQKQEQEVKQQKEEVTPELISKYKEPAVKALQEELILDQLSRNLELEVTPEELEQELQNMAQLLGAGGNLQQMKKEWEKNGVLARLHSRMKRDKTLNSALEKVKLKEVMVDRKDLIADNK